MKTNKESIFFDKDTIKFTLNSIVIVLMTLLYIAMILIFFDSNTEYEYGVRGYIVLSILYLLVTCVYYSVFKAYSIGNKTVIDISLSSIIAILFTDITMYFVFGLINGHLERVVPHLILFIIQCAVITFFSSFNNKYIKKKYKPYSSLVVYGHKEYKDLVSKLKKYQFNEFEIKKTVNENDVDYRNLEKVVSKYESVITYGISHCHKKKIAKKCYELDIKMYDVPSITDVFIKTGEVTCFIDTPLLKMNKIGPSNVEKIVKRVIDVLCSILLIIVTLPITLIVSIAIKIQDGGDIFFKQKRLTTNGETFELIKFRSMIMDAEPHGKMIRAKKNDNRITKLGKFIRATRIDELPQIINVLKGDMSFVGPRALRIEEYEEIENEMPEFRYRLKVKAGITGTAQIYGKYNTSYRDKLLMDIYYIQNYNIFEDIKLLMATFVIVMMKDSTEGF